MAWTVLPLMFLGWAGVSLWAAHGMGRWCMDLGAPGTPAVGMPWILQALLLTVLLPLPLIDELVAQAQFEALCRERTAARVQRGPLAPQGLIHSVSPAEPEPGLLVPVSRREHRYIDLATRQTLLSFFTFQAHAGKLARLAGRSDTPLTFPGDCGPPDPHALLARAGVQAQGPELPAGSVGSP